MTISKIFTEKRISRDMEARNWQWRDTDESYEELAEKLRTEWDGWFDAVAVVEKTFNDETFGITEKLIKMTRRTYDDNYRWNGAEEITEE